MNITDFTIKLAEKAGALVMKESKKKFKVREKSANNLVTEIDFASEDLIIKMIKSAYPNHEIMAEESSTGSRKNIRKISAAPYIWIVDPLDGTTNFAHGLPHYAVSIAAFKTKSVKQSKNFEYLEGEIVSAAIFAPALNEFFYAEKGKGSYLNGRKIHTSDVRKVSDSILVTGFPTAKRQINLPYFEGVLDKCQGIRRLGAASLDLAYVAAGRFDGYWEFGLSPWDIAAGALIVEEAGGKVTDTNGNLLDLFGKDLLSSNGKIHGEMVKIFSKI